MHYDTEQGGEYHHDGDQLDADLKPFLAREWGADVFISEFPYFQYAGYDFPPEDDDDVMWALEQDYHPDDPRKLRDFTAKKGPYRTDLVAVNPDRRALATRARRLGHLESMNGSGDAKRRRRRTYLSFVGDGPMTRTYWEGDHGGGDELRTYGEHSASRGFGWLKKRGFLAPIGAAWDAVDIPLHVYGRAHAVELKLSRNEWDTGLDQAARADVFADYRWLAMDADTVDAALANADEFRERGVGLLGVHPEDGVTVHVWAEQCTREVDRALLDRYNVERWDLNERVLSELTRANPERDHGRDEPRLSLDDLGVSGDGMAEPPTVNTGRDAKEHAPEDGDAGEHKPLTEFATEEP